MKTICLIMIVKNEMEVLPRCFESVYKYIDTYFICDTGSTDGTQKFIKDFFDSKGIKGTVQQDEWVDFGYNRTRAVQGGYGKADFLLLMDADFVFCIKDPKFKKDSNLNRDGYQIKYEGALDYRQMLFVSGKRKWRYIGVTHEYITCDGPKNFGSLNSFTFDHKCDGGNRSDKFERDIRLLEKGLKEDPANIRYMFYLAQSNKDLKRYDEAIKWYGKRAEAAGWSEEVYYAYYQIGMCKMLRGDKFDDFKGDLLKAYKYRPVRLEALHYLVNYCRNTKRFDLGYKYGMKAINNTYPENDMLFIEKYIHDWGFWDELAICSHYAGHHKTAVEIYKKLLDENRVPENQVKRFQSNMNFFKKGYEQELRKNFEEEQNSTRLAVVVVNMGNTDNTDRLVNKIKQTKADHDIVVVDNNTDKISNYTTLRLQETVNITAAWSLGLEYINMLARTKKQRYLAYCFTSSAVEIATDGDILTDFQTLFKSDLTVTGIHPSLTSDSHKTFKYMKHRKESAVDKISHFDNIFSCYRASWFDKSGKFNLDLLYTRGVAIELGYLADTDHKTLLLDNTNHVHYTEKYPDENDTDSVNEYFVRKYGINYKDTVYHKLGLRSTYKSLPATKETPKPNQFTIFIIYYGFSKKMGEIYATLFTYAQYFASRGDRVIVMERMPTNDEIEKFTPNCIISADRANSDIERYASIWGIPWVVLAFGEDQYMSLNDKYPTLVVYPTEYLKKQDNPNTKPNNKTMVMRPPVIGEMYAVHRDDPEYITLIGDPPESKGHKVLIELARIYPNYKFLMVTQSEYVDSPKNITTLSYPETMDELLNNVYQKTKVLLVPSTDGSMARVAIEATASDIPCLLSDNPNIRELTHNMSNYADPTDVKVWVDGLKRIMDNYKRETEKASELKNKLDYQKTLNEFREKIMTLTKND